jgi:hypothetical protein
MDICETTSVEQGIVGHAEEVLCDTGPVDECLADLSGHTIRVFSENPQLDGDGFPGPQDPDVPVVAETTTDGDGNFEIALDPGDYFVCAVEFTDEVLCSMQRTVPADGPLVKAEYSRGNGYFWTFGSCG